MSVQGQTALSLKEAMDRALQNNLEIRLARNNAEAAEISNHPGVAGALPSVNLSGGDVQQSTNIYQKLVNGTIIEREGAAGNTMNGSLTASYTLFNGYRISATRERLSKLQELGEAQLMAGIQSTLAAVIGRYYDVQRQEQLRSALERSRAFVSERVKVLETRARVGLANDADLFQARIDLNAAEQALVAQELAVRQTKLELARLLATPADSAINPTDTLSLDRTLRSDSVSAYLRRNPELVAAGAQVVINEQLEREVNAQRLPSLRLNGGYNFQRSQSEAGFSLINQSYGPNIGLSLQVP
ncbi:MAG: TolC family protein, partial [Bacteroidota bacterium]